MDIIHKDAIRRSRVVLVRDLNPEELFDFLISDNVFTPMMMEHIQSKPMRADKVRKLLDDLVRRGPNAYRLFLKGLRESGHGHLADEVEKNEETIRREKNPPNPRVAQATDPGRYVYRPNENNSFFNRRDQGDTNEQRPRSPLECASSNSLPSDMDWDNQSDTGSNSSQQLSQASSSASNTESTYAFSIRQNKCYEMESVPRGLFVVFNNKIFDDARFSTREGTDRDRDNLCQMFRNLGWIVEQENDLTSQEMMTKLCTLTTDPRLNEMDSLAIAILSHGEGNDMVILRDCRVKIKVIDIFKMFDISLCPALKGKPKLFIINACRGNEEATSSPEQYHSTTVHDAAESDICVLPSSYQRNVDSTGATGDRVVPNQDIVAAYSTFPGYVSLRDPEAGSWFVQSLVEVFSTKAKDTHVNDMLVDVNDKVARMQDEDIVTCMVPFPTSSLRKSWFLNPCQP